MIFPNTPLHAPIFFRFYDVHIQNVFVFFFRRNSVPLFLDFAGLLIVFLAGLSPQAIFFTVTP